HLVGTTGNGAYVSGGYGSGTRLGRGLTNPSPSHTPPAALVANGNSPAPTRDVSADRDLRSSTDARAHFRPHVLKHLDADVFALVCPDFNRVWVGTGDSKVHFSTDKGASWKDFSPGGQGPVTGIAADPNDLARVALVYAGFSGINRDF